MRKDIELKQEIIRRKILKKFFQIKQNYKENNSIENLAELVDIIEIAMKTISYTPILEDCLFFLGEYTLKQGYNERTDKIKEIIWIKVMKKNKKYFKTNC